MSKTLGPQAEWLNYAEIHARTVRALEGGSPARPLRKRGALRALKRGEQWALLEQEVIRRLNEAWRNMTYDPDCPEGMIFMVRETTQHVGDKDE